MDTTQSNNATLDTPTETPGQQNREVLEDNVEHDNSTSSVTSEGDASSLVIVSSENSFTEIEGDEDSDADSNQSEMGPQRTAQDSTAHPTQTVHESQSQSNATTGSNCSNEGQQSWSTQLRVLKNTFGDDLSRKEDLSEAYERMPCDRETDAEVSDLAGDLDAPFTCRIKCITTAVIPDVFDWHKWHTNVWPLYIDMCKAGSPTRRFEMPMGNSIRRAITSSYLKIDWKTSRATYDDANWRPLSISFDQDVIDNCMKTVAATMKLVPPYALWPFFTIIASSFGKTALNHFLRELTQRMIRTKSIMPMINKLAKDSWMLIWIYYAAFNMTWDAAKASVPAYLQHQSERDRVFKQVGWEDGKKIRIVTLVENRPVKFVDDKANLLPPPLAGEDFPALGAQPSKATGKPSAQKEIVVRQPTQPKVQQQQPVQQQRVGVPQMMSTVKAYFTANKVVNAATMVAVKQLIQVLSEVTQDTAESAKCGICGKMVPLTVYKQHVVDNCREVQLTGDEQPLDITEQVVLATKDWVASVEIKPQKPEPAVSEEPTTAQRLARAPSPPKVEKKEEAKPLTEHEKASKAKAAKRPTTIVRSKSAKTRQEAAFLVQSLGFKAVKVGSTAETKCLVDRAVKTIIPKKFLIDYDEDMVDIFSNTKAIYAYCTKYLTKAVEQKTHAVWKSENSKVIITKASAWFAFCGGSFFSSKLMVRLDSKKVSDALAFALVSIPLEYRKELGVDGAMKVAFKDDPEVSKDSEELETRSPSSNRFAALATESDDTPKKERQPRANTKEGTSKKAEARSSSKKVTFAPDVKKQKEQEAKEEHQEVIAKVVMSVAAEFKLDGKNINELRDVLKAAREKYTAAKADNSKSRLSADQLAVAEGVFRTLEADIDERIRAINNKNKQAPTLEQRWTKTWSLEVEGIDTEVLNALPTEEEVAVWDKSSMNVTSAVNFNNPRVFRIYTESDDTVKAKIDAARRSLAAKALAARQARNQTPNAQ